MNSLVGLPDIQMVVEVSPTAAHDWWEDRWANATGSFWSRRQTDICGLDMYPEEPGHYVCEEQRPFRLPHCMECHVHHHPDPAVVTCDQVEQMMAADEALWRYAR